MFVDIFSLRIRYKNVFLLYQWFSLLLGLKHKRLSKKIEESDDDDEDDDTYNTTGVEMEIDEGWNHRCIYELSHKILWDKIICFRPNEKNGNPRPVISLVGQFRLNPLYTEVAVIERSVNDEKMARSLNNFSVSAQQLPWSHIDLPVIFAVILAVGTVSSKFWLISKQSLSSHSEKWSFS